MICPKVYDQLRQWQRDCSAYFKNAAVEIAEMNIALLQMVSAISFVAVFFFVFITPFIMPQWHVTQEYWTILPSMFVSFIVASLYKHRCCSDGILKPLTVQIFCCLFYSLLLGHFFCISIFPYPEMPDIFVSLAYMFIPIICINPPQIILPVLGLFEIGYCFLALHYKTPAVASFCVFSTIVSFVLSCVVTIIITNLRVRDYMTRRRFELWCKTDKLTGILNKGAFEEAARFYLETRGSGENCTLFVIDMDNFKAVNDTLGHLGGDTLLEGVGSSLLRIFRGSDIIGRIGGDEFCVLMKNIVDTAIIMSKTEVIEKNVAEILPRNNELRISCSIGAAIVINDGVSYESLFEQADRALYEAKHQGKCRCFIAG